MKQFTKTNIEKLALDIMLFLDAHHMQDGVCIYFNNKRIRSDSKWDGENLTYEWVEEDNIYPHDYFDYAAHEHILSMSFEGSLYDCLNYSFGEREEQFRAIFEKYDLYFELGNAWNLTVYTCDDDMEVEYTYYNRPQPVTDLYYHSRANYPKEIATIMEVWYKLSENEGDRGSCVIGAGFQFKYKETKYFMNACTPYQGSLAHEANVDHIKNMLERIGATEIYFDYGRMD